MSGVRFFLFLLTIFFLEFVVLGEFLGLGYAHPCLRH